MPEQVENIQIVNNGDGTCMVAIGQFEHNLQTSRLLDRSNGDREKIVRQNLSFAFQIGKYAEPDSVEFLDAVNKGTIGMECPDGKVFINSIEFIGDGQYQVSFGSSNGVSQFSISLGKSDFTGEGRSPVDEVILDNLRVFLRIAGHTSMTQAAIDSVKARPFWR